MKIVTLMICSIVAALITRTANAHLEIFGISFDMKPTEIILKLNEYGYNSYYYDPNSNDPKRRRLCVTSRREVNHRACLVGEYTPRNRFVEDGRSPSTEARNQENIFINFSDRLAGSPDPRGDWISFSCGVYRGCDRTEEEILNFLSEKLGKYLHSSTDSIYSDGFFKWQEIGLCADVKSGERICLETAHEPETATSHAGGIILQRGNHTNHFTLEISN